MKIMQTVDSQKMLLFNKVIWIIFNT